MRKATPFTFYFLYFAATAALIPFIVLYYQQLGFTGGQIGLLAGMSPLIVLVGAPFWTGVADSTAQRLRGCFRRWCLGSAQPPAA